MRIQSLDGLRAVLALWVVFAHLAPIVGLRVPLVANPAVAVDLFMVLSGFLMASTYESLGRTYADWRRPAVLWIRRVMRIWPLFAFLLTLVWVFYAPLQGYHDTAAAALRTGVVQQGVLATTPGKMGLSATDALWHYSMLFGLND
jgi:peptidoglycan/LPS O-acetylase OafA/YrhL